jgi:hypothetical protein
MATKAVSEEPGAFQMPKFLGEVEAPLLGIGLNILFLR